MKTNAQKILHDLKMALLTAAMFSSIVWLLSLQDNQTGEQIRSFVAFLTTTPSGRITLLIVFLLSVIVGAGIDLLVSLSRKGSQ